MVALLVRMDGVGQFFIRGSDTVTDIVSPLFKHTGTLLIISLPKIVWSLGFIGTIGHVTGRGGTFLHHTLDFIPWIFLDLVAGMIIVSIVHVVMKIKRALIS